ncbi:MAG: alpha/beta hydrolase [Bacteroidota bacterium]
MLQRRNKKADRPSLFWLLTETGRAVTELGLNYTYQWWNAPERSGDGHPVLVLPGFLASAYSTVMLRNFLKRIGYQAYDWEIGRNYGKVEYLDRLLQQVDALHAEHGRRISLVGWSLGGVYAREIAKRRPQIIRQVITMGSPFQGVKEANNASWMHELIKLARQTGKEAEEAFMNEIPKPAPVPTTAIYSKEDGVVPWRLCMEKVEDAWHQNIQVRSSHLGFGLNPSVYNIIADRLQYEPETWLHFEPASAFQDWVFYPSL